MRQLRDRLRADCEEKLDLMIDMASEAIGDVVSHTGVAVVEVAKLIGNTRTDTLRNTVLRRMVNKAEAELVELYNDQHTLKLEDKDAA